MIALLPRHAEWSAIVAGRATAEHKPFEDELKARVAKAGLADRILFVGEHRDIERWYRALSLYVAPQRWEGFGLTPLEAMASGVPVVAADVGAFSEMVPAANGAIVAPDDLQALVAAVRPYLEDQAMRLESGKRALEHVRLEFPLSREVADLAAVYDGIWTEAA